MRRQLGPLASAPCSPCSPPGRRGRSRGPTRRRSGWSDPGRQPAATRLAATTPEILRAEGMNEFAVADVSSVDAAALRLPRRGPGPAPLSPSQVADVHRLGRAGGNLIAMRPDTELASCWASRRRRRPRRTATSRRPPPASARGSSTRTMQYHGTADRYTLAGRRRSRRCTPRADGHGEPAVTVRAVGANGGQAAAFTYDLARSVVYTRQGNPAWAGQERDGDDGPDLSRDSLRRRATSSTATPLADPQPDWVDLDKVDIPQADKQQRLLANLIQAQQRTTSKPLPRFWYLPRGERAAARHDGR